MKLVNFKKKVLRAIGSQNVSVLITALFLVFFVAACGGGDKEAPVAKKAPTGSTVPSGAQPLPEGHPEIPAQSGSVGKISPQAHRQLQGKSGKELRLSDEITASWKTVNVEVTDNSSGDARVVTINVGERVKLNNDGFAMIINAFVPEYAIFDDHIGSRSNEPNNPAILVELYENDNVVASGWVFAELTSFNSYSHLRFALALKAPFTPTK